MPSSLHFEKPVEYFPYFLTTSVIRHIIEQSVLYSVQTRPSKPISLSAVEWWSRLQWYKDYALA